LLKVNQALAQWKSDGTLDRVLLRWIPYLKKYESLQ
jgi:ABC-type amino acid transport substrate-binding protein